jgi:hypothetical protein
LLNKKDMSIQIIQGGNGQPAGVFIPINDWEIMKKENKNLEAWEEQKKQTVPSVASLRGKLNLSQEQYEDFQQHIKRSRNEWK